MKILYRYIFKEHIGPFVFALSVIMFILLMQFLVKYIGQIFGKGIPLLTIFELITLNLAWMLALAVPMATLIAVLMAFGRFSADNEITILKSAGISIYRIIRPSLAFGLILTFGMIYFNDQILPETNHAARKMMQAIKRKKPTLSLEPHIFYEMNPFAFVVESIKKPPTDEWTDTAKLLGPDYVEKNKEIPDKLLNVTIFDRSSAGKTTTINATEGYMVYSPQRKALVFTLFNGEFHELDSAKPEEYQRSDFSRHVVYIPARNFELEESESEYRGDREMNTAMMMEQVRKSRKQIEIQKSKTASDLQSHFAEIDKLLAIIQNDSLNALTDTLSLADLDDHTQRVARLRAIRQAERQYQQIKANATILTNQEQNVNKFLVEIYKKYSIPFASIVFVLVGAPLGIMTRKGSMGVAITMSIGFFLMYWMFLIGGEKLADRQIVSPFWAMWSPNFLLFVVGVYLVWRAVKESSFIDWNKLRRKFRWAGVKQEETHDQ